MAQTPYHALNKRKRKAYNDRRQLLSLMGDLLRQAAVRMERCRLVEEESQGILSKTDFVFTDDLFFNVMLVINCVSVI